MTQYVLLKSTEPKGAALYYDDELVATWDKHEPEKSVATQVSMRCGDAEVVERNWTKGPFPYDLPPEKKRTIREPAPAAVEGGDAE